MPSKLQPKYHVLSDGSSFSWDQADAPAREAPRAKRYNRRCKCCGIWLTTPAEDKIGVHISCVQEANNKQRRLAAFTMNRPRYGIQRND